MIEPVQTDPQELRPYPTNPKLHTQDQITRLAHSIQEFGWTQPIVADENKTVLIGHARLAASLKLELEKVPVLFLNNLTETEKAALVVFDNTSTKETGFDDEKILEALREFETTGADFAKLGLKLEVLGNPDKIAREQDRDTTAEAKERFDNAEVKQIVLYFEDDEIDLFLGELQLASQIAGATTRAEVLQAVLEFYETSEG